MNAERIASELVPLRKLYSGRFTEYSDQLTQVERQKDLLHEAIVLRLKETPSFYARNEAFSRLQAERRQVLTEKAEALRKKTDSASFG